MAAPKDPYFLTLISGRPFLQQIRVKEAHNIWASLDLLAVRAQMRAGKSANDRLIANLHTFMTYDFDDVDLLINWSMTGEETRTLYNLKWGLLKRGYFNIVVSDVGTVDAHAVVVPTVTIRGVNTTMALPRPSV